MRRDKYQTINSIMAESLNPLLRLSLSPPPDVSCATIADLAGLHYGIVGHVEPIAGETDRSFSMHAGNRRYVVKLFNVALGDPDLAFRTALLQRLAAEAPDILCPRITPTLNGEPWARVKGSGATHRVQVQSWLDGVVPQGRTLTPTLAHALGQMAAATDRALEHGLAEGDTLQPCIWDIRQIVTLVGVIGTPDDALIAPMVSAAVAGMAEAQPRLSALPVQPIHNDVNPSNILMSQDSSHIAGLIDFGDAVMAPAVQDLAVAAAYQIGVGDDGLDSVAALVAGYCSRRPLLTAEWEVLPALVAARLALTLIVTAWRARLFPQNRAYILRNADHARGALAMWLTMKPADIIERLGRDLKA